MAEETRYRSYKLILHLIEGQKRRIKRNLCVLRIVTLLTRLFARFNIRSVMPISSNP